MPLVARKGGAAGANHTRPPAAKQRAAKEEPASTELSIPDEPDEPISDMGDATWLIYGERKIGKTSLASKFPRSFFLLFEPGGKGLRLRNRRVTNWDQFRGYVTLLRQNDTVDTVVIDTVDVAYDRCFDAVCKREGFDHPSEEEWGKGWGAIDKEFRLQMTRLLNSGKGVVFISHAEDKQFTSRTGVAYQKIVPTMAKQARKWVLATVDVIAYYGYWGKYRYLTLQGSDEIDAGHRLEEHFWVQGGEERVHSIPMFEKDDPQFGAQEAYDNLLRAWNNDQPTNGEPRGELDIRDLPRQGKLKRTR